MDSDDDAPVPYKARSARPLDTRDEPPVVVVKAKTAAGPPPTVRSFARTAVPARPPPTHRQPVRMAASEIRHPTAIKSAAPMAAKAPGVGAPEVGPPTVRSPCRIDAKAPAVDPPTVRGAQALCVAVPAVSAPNLPTASEDTDVPQALDAEQDWYPFRVQMRTYWAECASGIIDARMYWLDKPRAAEGKQLQNAYKRCCTIIKRHSCEFKVGMARSLADRWRLYDEEVHKWQPSHMFIILKTRGREAVGFLEASLIALLQLNDRLHESRNINLRNNDLGGTGPRIAEQLNDIYYVYLAVRLL